MNIKKFLAGSLAAVMAGSTLALGGLAAVSSDLGDWQAKFADNWGTSVTTPAGTASEGEFISLDTSADRLWLNTSLNAVKSALTDSDLPTVLADSTFSGDVTATATPTIKLVAGAAAGGDNSGKVIFSKQPKSTNDPAILLNPSTRTGSSPFYNASVTFSKAVNFTHADSEGEELTLFGQTFTVSSSTDTTNLVLLKQAKKVDLSTEAPTADVTIDGAIYTVELISASDTAASIKITNSAGVSASKEVNEAQSKRINGVDVAVITADETNLKLSASVIIGSQKITMGESGGTATMGENDDPIDGTTVYIVGGTDAVTELAVTVFAPDTSSDAVSEGESFVDPVFGSFKLDFAGLSSSLNDESRDTLSVQNSGDKAMSITMADQDGNSGTFEFAYNATYAANQANISVYKPANWRLADDANFSIFVHEGGNLTEDQYLVLGNEDYGHIVQVTQIYNDTSGTYGNDKAKFRDLLSGTTYDTVFTSSGVGSLTIDGKQYTVLFPQEDGTRVSVKYPTGDSSTTTTFVMYPTIETKSGALVQLYEPLNFSVEAFNGTSSASTVVNLPDGDGYTAVTFTYAGNSSSTATLYTFWTVSGASATTPTLALNESGLSGNYTNLTVGTLTYNVTAATGVANRTQIHLYDPEGGANVDQPAVLMYEGKDDDNNYHVIVIDLETAPPGTSTDGVGVNDVLFSSDKYHVAATHHTDSDITDDVDWWGTLVTTNADDSDQKKVNLTYPSTQVYAQLYLSAKGATVATAGTSATSTTTAPAATLKAETFLVVGADSKSEDVVGVGDLAAALSNGGVDVLGATRLDTEVSSSDGKNLVIVGGPAVNRKAAELLGLSYPSYGAASGIQENTAVIALYENAFGNGTVALLVAGYEAENTRQATTKMSSDPSAFAGKLKVVLHPDGTIEDWTPAATG